MCRHHPRFCVVGVPCWQIRQAAELVIRPPVPSPPGCFPLLLVVRPVGVCPLSQQFLDLAFSRATALANSPTRPPLPRPLPRPLAAVLPAAWRCDDGQSTVLLSVGSLDRSPYRSQPFRRAKTGWRQPCSEPPLCWSSTRGPGRPPGVVSRYITLPVGGLSPTSAHMAVRSAAAVRLARLPLSQREIVGPLLRPPPSFLRPSASTAPSQSVSLQTSQQLSSGVAAPPHRLSPVPLAPLDPLPSPPCSSPPPPPLAHPPLPSSAGAPLVPPPPSPPGPRASLPPVEPPQGQHPLVPSGPAPEARFPPRSRSPELPPDAPDPEDDGCWWNGELWETPPQPATLWGREWDIQSDFVKDVLRWERRMLAVGECMSHVATILE
ncbi:unnamed protein product [Closterium sp. NIES-64]|nr:unnamed protein product [Closterium sp. NIES-64]